MCPASARKRLESLKFLHQRGNVRELILASSSRYRAELLERLGLPFACHSPDIDETRHPGEPAQALVERLARGKAAAVAGLHPHAVVIGSDQVAVCGDRILGKPGTAQRARDQLEFVSGRQVDFLTGLCVLDGGDAQLRVVPTRVRFRKLNTGEIADYVARDRPLDCAGACKSESLGIALLAGLSSDDPTALIGLPLIELCGMLEARGIRVLGERA